MSATERSKKKLETRLKADFFDSVSSISLPTSEKKRIRSLTKKTDVVFSKQRLRFNNSDDEDSSSSSIEFLVEIKAPVTSTKVPGLFSSWSDQTKAEEDKEDGHEDEKFEEEVIELSKRIDKSKLKTYRGKRPSAESKINELKKLFKLAELIEETDSLRRNCKFKSAPADFLDSGSSILLPTSKKKGIRSLTKKTDVVFSKQRLRFNNSDDEDSSSSSIEFLAEIKAPVTSTKVPGLFFSWSDQTKAEEDKEDDHEDETFEEEVIELSKRIDKSKLKTYPGKRPSRKSKINELLKSFKLVLLIEETDSLRRNCKFKSALFGTSADSPMYKIEGRKGSSTIEKIKKIAPHPSIQRPLGNMAKNMGYPKRKIVFKEHQNDLKNSPFKFVSDKKIGLTLNEFRKQNLWKRFKQQMENKKTDERDEDFDRNSAPSSPVVRVQKCAARRTSPVISDSDSY